MNIKILTAALGVALIATAFNANAQKTYTMGVASYDTEVRGNPATAKQYFDADSSALVVTFGAGSFKVLTSANHTFLAVVLDIPVAGLKKAGIATPAELEQGAAAYPTFVFTKTTETKQISGFNCTKVTAKDSKSGTSYDIWVTNDVMVPATAILPYYRSIGGFPIQYTYFQPGQDDQTITIKSITADPAPAGTYAIDKDFEKTSLSDLMSGQ